MAADSGLPKDGRSLRIWTVVEDLILNRYDELADERMRDSYYLLREWLESLRADGDITDAEYDKFADKYEYYRDDKWPVWEAKYDHLTRPQTKPPTVVIESGTEYTEDRLDRATADARGFIFVEKSGMAADLKQLSYEGWLIVAAQGESTRTFRERVATDGTDRPILVVTDADSYGDSIISSLKGESTRTEHLDLDDALADRVTALGLTPEDADGLDLPRERDSTGSDDEYRTELNALTVLKDRYSIDEPLLAYVTAKMAALGLPPSPPPLSGSQPEQRVRSKAESQTRQKLRAAINRAVSRAMTDFDAVADLPSEGKGGLMRLRRQGSRSVGTSPLVDDELEAQLTATATDALDGLYWQRQSDYIESVWNNVDGFETVTGSLGVSTDPTSVLDDYDPDHAKPDDGAEDGHIEGSE